MSLYFSSELSPFLASLIPELASQTVRSTSSGSKARFSLAVNVGAEAPNPEAVLHIRRQQMARLQRQTLHAPGEKDGGYADAALLFLEASVRASAA
jgi:hypothetical protein